MAPKKVIVASLPFDFEPDALAVAQAVGGGVREADPRLEVVVAPLDRQAGWEQALAALPSARAVVLCEPTLCAELAPTAAFRFGQEARQRGVAAYAVTAAAQPNRFYARIIDLQLVLTAAGRAALRGAGRSVGRAAAQGLELAGELPGRLDR